MTNISSFGSGDLIPQEEKLELKKQAKSLFIGVSKEITFQESRIAIVLDATFNCWSVMVMKLLLNLKLVKVLTFLTLSLVRQELKLFMTLKKSIKQILS